MRAAFYSEQGPARDVLKVGDEPPSKSGPFRRQSIKGGVRARARKAAIVAIGGWLRQ